MTPGYAKKRSELPHLYYPRADTVRVINAHRGGPWYPEVNGKSPTAAWVPSRDSAGNGTGTLTDLTGNGHDGTLTSMDPASDWVVSGGKYGLDFDATNDYVTIADNAALEGFSDFSISAWFYPRTSGQGGFGRIIEKGDYAIYLRGTNGITSRAGSGSDLVQINSGAYSLNTWSHVVLTHSATGDQKLYINGVVIGSRASAGALATDSDNLIIGNRATLDRAFDGLIDDVRLFGTDELDTIDVADLYKSGNGRGVNAS